MPASLQFTLGSSITIQTTPDAKVAELKALIAMATGMLASDQVLWVGGSALLDGTTLSSSGVSHGFTVLLKASSEPPPAPPPYGGSIKLMLPTSLASALDRPWVMVPAEANSTVGSIKAVTASITGVDASEQTLTYSGGSSLGNPSTLSSVGLAMPSGTVLALSVGSGASLPSFVAIIALPPPLQPLFGQTVSMSASASSSISELKILVESAVGVHPAEQTLWFGGLLLGVRGVGRRLQLTDLDTLGAAGIGHGDMILLTLPFASPLPPLPSAPPSPPPPTFPIVDGSSNQEIIVKTPWEVDVVGELCEGGPVVSAVVGVSAATALTAAAALSASSFTTSLSVASLQATANPKGATSTAMSIMMGAQRYASSSGLLSNASASYKGAVAATSWAYGDFDDREPVCCKETCKVEVEEVRALFICDSLKRIMLGMLIALIIVAVLHAVVHMLWRRTVNRRWYQLRKWRMVGLRSAPFVPFPSIFVFPGLYLMVMSAFLAGMAGRAITVLLHVDCQAASCLGCRLHAWAAILIILLYTSIIFVMLCQFNSHHRAVAWQPSKEHSTTQELFECCRFMCCVPRPHAPHVNPSGGPSKLDTVGPKRVPPIDRALGHFVRPEADISEPGRTERLLATPMRIRPNLTGDFLDAYGYALLLRSGGMSGRAASFEVTVLVTQLAVALLNGCGAGLQLTPGATPAVVLRSTVFSVQVCAALVVSLVSTSADPLQSMTLAVQFSLEGCQTLLLMLHELNPAMGLEQASMLCAIGALLAPIVLQAYDTFLVASQVGTEGFSLRRLLLYITNLLTLVPRLVMRLLGIQIAEHSALDGIDEITEHAGTDMVKVVEHHHDEVLENKLKRNESLAAGWSATPNKLISESRIHGEPQEPREIKESSDGEGASEQLDAELPVGQLSSARVEREWSSTMRRSIAVSFFEEHEPKMIGKRVHTALSDLPTYQPSSAAAEVAESTSKPSSDALIPSYLEANVAAPSSSYSAARMDVGHRPGFAWLESMVDMDPDTRHTTTSFLIKDRIDRARRAPSTTQASSFPGSTSDGATQTEAGVPSKKWSEFAKLST